MKPSLPSKSDRYYLHKISEKPFPYNGGKIFIKRNKKNENENNNYCVYLQRNISQMEEFILKYYYF